MDLISYCGKTFGGWLVLYPLKSKHKSFIVMAQCKCGAEHEVYLASLRNQRSKGCHKCRGKRDRIPYRGIYNYLLRKAKRRGKSVKLSYKAYLKFTGCACHYCDSKINWQPLSDFKTGYFLDCKNPKLGYSTNNVVPCCPLCNWTKNSRFSYNEFLQIGKVIKKIIKQRKQAKTVVEGEAPQGKQAPSLTNQCLL
jgi:hypothetical protein